MRDFVGGDAAGRGVTPREQVEGGDVEAESDPDSRHDPPSELVGMAGGRDEDEARGEAVGFVACRCDLDHTRGLARCRRSGDEGG